MLRSRILPRTYGASVIINSAFQDVSPILRSGIPFFPSLPIPAFHYFHVIRLAFGWHRPRSLHRTPNFSVGGSTINCSPWTRSGPVKDWGKGKRHNKPQSVCCNASLKTNGFSLRLPFLKLIIFAIFMLILICL